MLQPKAADESRAALGYETINLYGGSYGTRAGLVYMRCYPERVRTAVLVGRLLIDVTAAACTVWPAAACRHL